MRRRWKIASSGGMMPSMAGKAPLLLAMVLFSVGAAGLALTSAERAKWGPFEPRAAVSTSQAVVYVPMGTAFVPPSLQELFTSAVEAAPAPEEPTALLAQAPAEAVPEEPAAPAPTPLRVFGISADGGDVSAAATTPTPAPLRGIGVAADDAPAPEAPTQPEASEIAAPSATETPSANEPSGGLQTED
jgi:hypothetical protein